MTLASDQKLDASKLSATAKRVLALRETVLAEWEKRVRAAVMAARELREPVFIDTIPSFYDNIVEAISPEYPRSTAVEGVTLACSHGGERARMSSYEPDLLILEYQIFRWTFFGVLEESEIQLTFEERTIINASIDAAVREAVMAFNAVVSAQREQFIAALTHDMRTPLNSASLAAELITHLNDPVRMKELAQKILFNLKRMDKMITGILDTMVFQTGQKLKLDISHFDVVELIQEVKQHAPPADAARLEVAGQSVQGWWGRETLKRAIENLVGNALKYGAPGEPVKIVTDASHDNLILSVRNSGMPIASEDQSSIFESFRRTTQAKQGPRQGWGVGLPFVRAVAESHGGSVVLDSAEERGTTFTIMIPQDSRPYQAA